MNGFVGKILACAFFMVCCPQAIAKKVAANGETELEFHAKGAVIDVLIRTLSIDIGKPSDGIPLERTNNCTYSRYPCSVVQFLEISVGATKIFVPRSSYADLSDLSDASVYYKDGSMILILKGGDASEAYVVKLFFDKEHVYRRLLFPSGGQGRATEDAKYKMIDSD